MAKALARVGNTLVVIDEAGALSVLTLPSGVVISTSYPARCAALLEKLYVAYAPNWLLSVDRLGAILSPGSSNFGRPPSAPTASLVDLGVTDPGQYWVLAGPRTSVFSYSYAAIDSDGLVTEESERGPEQSYTFTTTLPAHYADVLVTVTAPTDPKWTHCRLWDRSGGGATQYLAESVPIAVTSFLLRSYGASGAGSAFAGVAIGSSTLVGRVRLLAAHKDYLFAVRDEEPDSLRYCENRQPTIWPASNQIPLPDGKRDDFGPTAFLARRDELAIAHRDSIWRLLGSSEDDFILQRLVEGIGCVSQETVVTVRDTVIFLGEDGVYSWGPEGVKCISEKVRFWFTRDTAFNRSQFSNAFATFDPEALLYHLFLYLAGSTSAGRWVSYSLHRDEWYGPHLPAEALITPSSAHELEDASDQNYCAVGAYDGKLYRMTPGTFWDGKSVAHSAIPVEVEVAFHVGEDPDVEKVWGQLSTFAEVQAGGAITITPTVGWVNAAAGATLSHALTAGRVRHRRLGLGKLLKLKFFNNTDLYRTRIFGYEIPYWFRGRR
jgi:hypothetical protein